MIRSTGLAGFVFAALLTLGSTSEASSQERPTLTGEASCINAGGRYVITWTLTVPLADQQTATAETAAGEFPGLDLIGQPQGEEYLFSVDAGNIFTAGNGRVVNGANVARTSMDVAVYNPDTVQAMGRIVLPGGPVDVEATVRRPAACAA